MAKNPKKEAKTPKTAVADEDLLTRPNPFGPLFFMVLLCVPLAIGLYLSLTAPAPKPVATLSAEDAARLAKEEQERKAEIAAERAARGGNEYRGKMRSR